MHTLTKAVAADPTALDEERNPGLPRHGNHEQFRLAFAHAPIGMALLRLDGAILEVNQALCAILGHEESHLLAMRFQDLSDPRDREADQQFIDCLKVYHHQSHAGGPSTCLLEKHYLRSNGSIIWVEICASVVESDNSSPSHAVITVRDISDQRLATVMERDRRRLMEMVAEELSMHQVMTSLLELIENQIPDIAASVLLVQDGAICQYAANLPQELSSEVEQHSLRIASDLVAAHGADRASVFCSTFEAIVWSSAADKARGSGFQSAWVTPVFQKDGARIGLIVIYSREGCGPSATQRRTLLTAGELCTVVVDHYQTHHQLAYLVQHDSLTGLPNRILFEDRLQQALSSSRRDGRLVGLLAMDIDRFKSINDTLGHQAGDSLLQQFAQRLRENLRSSDTIARMGGDEFTIILPDLKASEHAAMVARKLIAAAQEPFSILGQQVHVSTSLGISIFPTNGNDSPSLQKMADEALYKVKSAGRNGFQFASE
ncbi:MAG TPA: diguanylate cyclase [Tepidisphaeraceae bacterium]|nr:diguanylate cyclase [Tepidisphaeraceae bacterium]